MANEIYHRSNWGNAVNDNAWGDVYQKFDATNEMFIRSDNYENSNETDKLMAAINPKPSILLTPTAYDNGSLHSVKPVKTFGSELVTNGDFSTDSDWTLQSAWTISNGKAIYDNSASQSCSQSLDFVIGKKYQVNFEISDFTTDYRFDLYTGTSFIQSAIITDQTTFSILFNGDGGNLLRFRGLARGTGFSLDNVSVKEVTEADFDFTRGTAATRVNEQGLVANVTDTNLPRINYTGGTGQILLEPQSTNLVTDSAGGNYGNNPGSEILTTAPDGTNTAVRPVPNSTSDRYQYTISGGSYATDSKLTYTWYRKRITTPIDTSHTGDLKIQILVNCTQVGSTTQIETDVNGFDRFEAIFNITDGSAATLIRGYFGQSIGVGNSSIAYWGHQVEPLEFSTSLIPTSGSTSTRNADVANNSGSSDLINSTEGVLYVEASALANDGTSRRISLNDGTSSNKVNIEYDETANRIRASITSGGSAQTLTYNATNLLEFNKIAVKYKQDDFAIWLNGVEVVTDTSGNAPIGLSELGFNNSGTSLPFYGNVKSVAVYKEALTDAQLTALTT